MCNFKKLMDTPECDLLFERYPDAFILITIIAKKAMHENCTASMGIAKGQTFIGDYKKFGLTESRYRKAKMQLAKFGFVSFKTTNRGTIATMVGTRIYDVNSTSDNELATVKQQPETACEEIKNQNSEPLNPVNGYENIRKKIINSAPELNAMFREKVILPLRRELSRTVIEEFIEPLVIQSIDEKENIAYLYHRKGKDISAVHNLYREKIGKKLGMTVMFVDGVG